MTPPEDAEFGDWPLGSTLFSPNGACGENGVATDARVYENPNSPMFVRTDLIHGDTVNPEITLSVQRRNGASPDDEIGAPIVFLVECFNIDPTEVAGAVDGSVPPRDLIAFVTSTAYTAGFGGVALASRVCQAHADNSDLEEMNGRDFFAHLYPSNDDAPLFLVFDNFVRQTPYRYRLAGNPDIWVTEDIDELRHFGAGPLNPINRDENGVVITDTAAHPAWAWIGSILFDGGLSQDPATNCNNWTSRNQFDTGTVIDPMDSGADWLDVLENIDTTPRVSCGQLARIFCFESPR